MNGALAAQALVAVLCLCAVVLLILGAARLAQAVPALRTQRQAASGLNLAATLALDRHRRLHLMDIDGRQVLLLTGGGSDVMIALPAKP
jgi:hypothetical protein